MHKDLFEIPISWRCWMQKNPFSYCLVIIWILGWYGTKRDAKILNWCLTITYTHIAHIASVKFRKVGLGTGYCMDSYEMISLIRLLVFVWCGEKGSLFYIKVWSKRFFMQVGERSIYSFFISSRDSKTVVKGCTSRDRTLDEAFLAHKKWISFDQTQWARAIKSNLCGWQAGRQARVESIKNVFYTPTDKFLFINSRHAYVDLNEPLHTLLPSP